MREVKKGEEGIDYNSQDLKNDPSIPNE